MSTTKPPKLDTDPARVNQPTGCRLKVFRPKVISIGPDHLYKQRFGELWLGSQPAILAGHAQLFGTRPAPIYSLEVVPGGFIFLINVANPLDLHLVCDLSGFEGGYVKRARAIMEPLTTALMGLGLLPTTPTSGATAAATTKSEP